MQHRRIVPLMVLLALLLPPGLVAAGVGRLAVVEGQVDLLHQGKLPAVPAKVQDEVNPGDVIRTKTQSRAEVHFVDDTILTLAPESRVAVADYFYDALQGRRRAVLQVFKGLVYCVVNRILKMEGPEFIMKSHTAVLGVRGTRWFFLLRPNFTDCFHEIGDSFLSSSFPEVPGVMEMRDMDYSRVAWRLPPTLKMKFTMQTLKILKEKWLIKGIPPEYDSGVPLKLLEGPRISPYLREGTPRFPEGLFVPPTQKVTPPSGPGEYRSITPGP
jgi:hypothetical protein